MKIFTLKGLEKGAAAKNRPAGYVADVLRHATHAGDKIILSDEAFAQLRAKYERLARAKGDVIGTPAKGKPAPAQQPRRENVGLRGRTQFEQDGSKHWASLHRSPNDPAWLEQFTRSIPCGSCKQHWRQLLKSMPPDYTSDESYFAWTVNAHNAVNQRLGKPIMPPWEARRIWRPLAGIKLDRPPEQHLKLDGYENRHLGKACMLICGGPSLADVDPALLNAPGIIRFAVNNAAAVIRPHYWTHGDRPDNFLASIWLDPTIAKFVPRDRLNGTLYDSQRRVPLDLRARDCAPVIEYDKREGLTPGNYLADGVVRWGDKKRSVMLAAIRIIYALGFTRVYLVGCDWHMGADKQYAFDEAKDAGAQRANNGLYDAIGKCLADLRPVLEAAGMTVLNATPGSKLAAFDAISIEQASRECSLINLGGIDWRAETTRGMYK